MKSDFKLDGRVSKGKNPPLFGNLVYDFKVLRNYDKKDFYGTKTQYEVINSDIEPFKNNYFWGDINTLKLNIKAQTLLQDMITD